jgi:hypothetical protein
MAKRPVRHADGGASGEIGIRDPFQLVRHLARSQSDPRKAVAELVQNALDEQATRVELVRRREQREVMLSITDNGQGVLPHLSRPEALETIARSIGQSRKRQLSFDERMRAAMLGQYGIGLLGFWSLGHQLRMLSRVADSEVWMLSLWEDSPKFEVERVPDNALHPPGTWTEVQVLRLHSAALPSTSGQRLATYLSAELRGQLLRHGTELWVRDHASRSTKDRALRVRPMDLAGERLDVPERIAVEGFTYPIELQLCLTSETESVPIRLAGAGALVLNDIRERPELEFAPWNDPRLGGIIDFPHLEVPPGSRRGLVSNAALDALIRTMTELGPRIAAELEAKAAAEATRLSAGTQKQLSKWFSQATQYVPHLDWFSVGIRAAALGTTSIPGLQVEAVAREDEASPDTSPQSEIFPPGPWTTLELRPKRVVVSPSEPTIVRIITRDAEGRPTEDEVPVRLEVEGPFEVELEPPKRIIVAAAARAGNGKLRVVASEQPEVRVEASLVVSDSSVEDAGIPRPEQVNEPNETWRSRFIGTSWQINVGHPDYRDLAADPKARLQYLAYLLAKEVVSRNFPRPEVGALLEQMVGVLAALERSRSTRA